jgi:hypothetical protein
MTERQQRHLQRILQVFLERPGQHLYGLDVGRLAGLRDEPIYPELMQLEQARWVVCAWANGPYPRQRLYWLNPDRPQHEQVQR